MRDSIRKYVVTKKSTVVQAMEKIDEGSKGVVFIVDDDESIIGCVTDGDIRRWLIKTADLSASVDKVMSTKPHFIYNSDDVDVENYMRNYDISALPVLDARQKICEIIFRNDCGNYCKTRKKKVLADTSVVIMAGGKGTRLHPYTKILPKPLIPIGEIPIIERIAERFFACGVDDFFFTVNYKKEMIKAYFNDLKPDYHVDYVDEDVPLGTAGSLKLINKRFENPIFVTNCDILIEEDLTDIYLHHINSKNDITVVSSLKNVEIPYGVLEVETDGLITEMREKPQFSYLVNTGMYIVNPELLQLIPDNTFYHMPQLIEKVIKMGKRVGMYPISETAFLDMGEIEEMKRMEERLKV